MKLLIEDARLDDEQGDPFAAPPDEADRLSAALGESVSLVELAAEPAEKDKGNNLLLLADPNPHRFMQGQLHDLWKEALQALQSQAAATKIGAKPAGHRPVPIGPYRLIVIPSIRGRAAGQIAIQGMANKQIELTTPTLRTRGSAAKPLLAIWLYRDNSLAIVHLDFMNSERYVLWHAPKSHQLNFEDPADFNHELFALGLEVPDQLNKVLTRSFKPANPA
jgi:serine/threonine-protein kinase